MSKEAKDKAEELIEKMSFETHKYNAIHCALIAIDEVLDLLRILEMNNSYYLEVKQEIINRQ